MPLLILAQRTAQFEVLNTLAPVLSIIYKMPPVEVRLIELNIE